MPRRVAIIGGGIIGLCAAYYLRRDGAQVVLLERDAIGAGSSLENAGLVVPSHFVPLAAPGVILQGLKWMFSPESPFYIRPRWDPALYRWLILFARASRESRVRQAMPLLRDAAQASLRLYGELSAAIPDIVLERRGLLMLYSSSAGGEHAKEEARLAQEIGISVRLLDREGVERLDPGIRYTVGGGAYYPGDAYLDPERFMAALEGEVRRLGAEIRTGTEILGCTARGSRIVALRTSGDIVEADEFVLASGAWSDRLARDLRLDLPLQPGKGYSITFPSPAGAPSIPSILVEARVAVTPLADRLRYAGTMELAGMEDRIEMRRVRAILRAVPKYYPGLASVDTMVHLRPWRGFRPCTPDGLPYVGRFRTYPNLIAATGHAMIGMTLAPITGRIVSDLVAERQPEIGLTLLSPDRFA